MKTSTVLAGSTALMSLTAALTGCARLDGAIDAANVIPSKMEETNRQLRQTTEGVRLQKMGEALKMMFAANPQELAPTAPTGVVPGAKIFAEAATGEEILSHFKLWMADINSVQLQKSFDESGSELPPSFDQRLTEFREKQRRWYMMKAIAAQIAQRRNVAKEEAGQEPIYGTTVEEMVGDHLQSELRPQLMQMLMLRADFTAMVLVNSALVEGENAFKNSAGAAKALLLMENVDWILRLPFRDEIAVKTHALLGPGKMRADKNEDLQLVKKAGLYVEEWNSIVETAKKVPKDIVRSDTIDGTANRRIHDREMQALSALQTLAEKKYYDWQAEIRLWQ